MNKAIETVKELFTSFWTEFGLPAILILGLLIGLIIFSSWLENFNQIDPDKEVAEIISCTGYEEDFLKEMGFQNRDGCVKLNLMLHEKYTDECLAGIKPYGEKTDDSKHLLSLCVYHSFSRNDIFLTSEYWLYKNKKLGEK